ncbi:polyprenol phosphomannose-dependent alpha 1,6 mannosyltransferase MptB [Nonomuraea thailandensis]
MTSQTHRGEARGRPAGAATAAICVSILLTITIGLLGPSAMVPSLGGPAWLPPFSLGVDPEPHLVIALAAAAIILGGLGLLGALLTLRRSPGPGSSGPGSSGPGLSGPRWLDPRWLVTAGCLAAGILAFLPPSGSGDHLNYAAYGRMVTLGLSPYTHGAVDLPGDPMADAVEEPWREEPSVYGPVATAVQALASWIAGDSLKLTMFVLALVNAAAFIATALLIDRFTRGDPAGRLRAALLWTANPLLLYQLVAGMHVDTLAIACMVAALLARSRPVGAGALLGLGVAVKVNAGLVALGPAWELRRRPARLALMAGCAVMVVVVGYAIVGPEAIAPMTRTSKSISHASPWKLVQGWLQSIVGTGSAYRGRSRSAPSCCWRSSPGRCSAWPRAEGCSAEGAAAGWRRPWWRRGWWWPICSPRRTSCPGTTGWRSPCLPWSRSRPSTRSWSCTCWSCRWRTCLPGWRGCRPISNGSARCSGLSSPGCCSL